MTTTKLNLETEARLDPSIHFDSPLGPNAYNPSHIFLTGSTGQLGGYLLGDLLRKTTAEMHCLVRGKDTDEAKARLIKNLQFYGRWEDEYTERIHPLLGNLSQKHFGLTEAHFQQLSGHIDAIFHSGGWVNNARPYEILKPTNVIGTTEAIRLATLTQMKPLHFVSSLATFFTRAHAGDNVVYETTVPEYDPNLKSGYIQSKWVADRLVQNAQSQGLPTSIYRPARITADSKTGQTKEVKDLLNLLIKCCIFMQKVPMLNVSIPMVPVDYISEAIVHLSHRPKSVGNAFHFINEEPIPWRELLSIIRGLGYEFVEMEYGAWRSELKKQVAQYPDKKFLKFLQVLLYMPNNLFFERPSFDLSNIHDGLAGTSIACPPIDQKLVSTYFDYFQKVEFLPTTEQLPISA